MSDCRFYSDYDDDDADGGGDVISIHDDDSEPDTDTVTEPAAKQSRLSDDVAMTTAAVTTDPEAAADVDDEVTVMEYWHANSYSVCLPADDTDDIDVLYEQCPRLKTVPCLVVDLKPGQMLYLPASWLYEVLDSSH